MGRPWEILLIICLWSVLVSASHGERGNDKTILWGVPDWQPYSNPPTATDVPGSINILLKIVTNNIKVFKTINHLRKTFGIKDII